MIDKLNAPLNPSEISSREERGTTLSYIEGHTAIRRANDIFGHFGWSRTCNVQFLANYLNSNDNHVVSYMAVCTVTVLAGDITVVRQGHGFGNGINKDLGKAHESAIKEAETDATKRALVTFGSAFGLDLYDPDWRNANLGKDGKAHGETTPNAKNVKPQYVEPKDIDYTLPDDASADVIANQSLRIHLDLFVGKVDGKLNEVRRSALRELGKRKGIKASSLAYPAWCEGIRDYDAYYAYIDSSVKDKEQA